jgi:hypothetical protein
MPINQGRSQFQGLFSEMWTHSESVDFGNASVGSGTFASVDVTVPGVALGDIVMGVSIAVDTVDTVIAGAVTAANTVTLTVLNNTAGAVNLAPAIVDFIVVRPAF